MKPRLHAFYFTLLLWACASAKAQIDEKDEFLEPVDSTLFEFHVDYHLNVRKLLLQAWNPVLQVVCLPSFSTEWAVGLEKTKGGHFTLIAVTAAPQIWSTVHSRDKRDPNALARVNVDRRSASVDAETAQRLQRIWNKALGSMLRRPAASHAKDEEIWVTADGNSYYFQADGADAPGKTHSPSENSPMGRLVALTHALYAYARTEPAGQAQALPLLREKLEAFEQQQPVTKQSRTQPCTLANQRWVDLQGDGRLFDVQLLDCPATLPQCLPNEERSFWFQVLGPDTSALVREPVVPECFQVSFEKDEFSLHDFDIADLDSDGSPEVFLRFDTRRAGQDSNQVLVLDLHEGKIVRKPLPENLLKQLSTHLNPEETLGPCPGRTAGSAPYPDEDANYLKLYFDIYTTARLQDCDFNDDLDVQLVLRKGDWHIDKATRH